MGKTHKGDRERKLRIKPFNRCLPTRFATEPKITATALVNTIHKSLESNPNCRYVFFLGAGCSVSSGIPTAGQLVEKWLQELRDIHVEEFPEFLKESIPDFDEKNPAKSFGAVLDIVSTLYSNRQAVIEKETEGKDPLFGYSIFAKLLTHEKFGRRMNLVLTTNFDDLIADSIYLYTKKKPFVIYHEKEADQLDFNDSRIRILKLHGDALRDPKATDQQIQNLDQAYLEKLPSLLANCAIVFMGYGGNDPSIVELLEKIEHKKGDAPHYYWVTSKKPDDKTVLGKWLGEHNTSYWVNHRGFDLLMLQISQKFGLELPKRKRFDDLFKELNSRLDKLQKEIDQIKNPKAKTESEKALNDILDTYDDPWKYAMKAEQVKNENPDLAEQYYEKAIELAPDNASILGNYALFLKKIRKDYDKAEEYYKKALEIDPKHANNLANYALFIDEIRKDYDEAEEYYKKALEIDPKHANNLGNYGNFMKNIRKDYDKAEKFFRKRSNLIQDTQPSSARMHSPQPISARIRKRSNLIQDTQPSSAHMHSPQPISARRSKYRSKRFPYKYPSRGNR